MVLIKQVPSAWLEKLSTLIYEAQTPLRGGVSRCPTRVGVRYVYDTRTTPVVIVKTL
jgi:hypothetical protein